MERAAGIGFWQLTILMIVIASWLLYRYVAPTGWREWSRAGLVQAFIIALYTGIFVGLFGQLIHWPTIPTIALFPVIVWAYVRLARREEVEMLQQFGDAYGAYRRRVPMFVPRSCDWPRLLEASRPHIGAR